MKRYVKRIITIIITLAVFAGAVVLYKSKTSKNPAEPARTASGAARSGGQGGGGAIPVEVYVADYMVVETGIPAIGTLLANEEVDITSEISGKVVQILFEEGTRVKRGDLLVKINDDDLQAQLKRARFHLDMLKEKLDRNRILFDKDAISREAFDQVETDHNMAEADVELLLVRIDKTEIRAPFDGVIGFRGVSLGAYLQPSTVIARLVDRSKLRMEFHIPERDIISDMGNMDVRFTVQNDQQVRRAQVYAMSPMLDGTTKVLTLRAMYDNSDDALLPNLSTTVILGQKSGESIAIPTQALITEASGKKVWLAKGGRAVLVPVVTSTRTESMVEVTQGLVRGDSVIVTGLMQVRDGVPLVINN